MVKRQLWGRWRFLLIRMTAITIGLATVAYTGTLTEADLALIGRIRDEWVSSGLSTAPVDKAAAERAFSGLYTSNGLQPVPVIWMDSPPGGLFAAAALRQPGDQPGDPLGGQLWEQIDDQIDDQIGGQLANQIWEQIEGQLLGQFGGQLWSEHEDLLGGQLRDLFRGQLGNQFLDQLGDQLGDQPWRQLEVHFEDQLEDQFWYQFTSSLAPWDEAYWIAFYQCAIRIAGLSAEPRLDARAGAVRAAGWLIPLGGVLIAGTRPVLISREEPPGRLHNATGPALAWADGYTLHAWHGTRVPASLIEEDWSAERALAEPNAEIRRCAIEKLGWDQFEAHLTTVAQAPDPGNPGQVLTLCELPARLAGMYREPARLLLCANGTPEPDGTRRRYGLPVPAHHTDPVEAAADLYGWTAEDYRQLQVRR
jgi:hypothetical protein